MVERADIDRLHQRIDATQAQNVKQNEMLTNMMVQLTEIATIVKGWPKPETRPCPYFLKHEAEDKLKAELLVRMQEHITESDAVRSDVRRAGIGIVARVAIFIIGGLLLLGLGALAERHFHDSPQGVTASHK